MKFNTAIDTILYGLDYEKWHKRYDAKDAYIFLGCEGRFIRRTCWPEGVYVTCAKIFDWPNYIKRPSENIILCDFSQYPIVYPTMDAEDVSENDWEVWDFIPNGKAKVDIEKGFYGFWSKFEHKFVSGPSGTCQETSELLPYWDNKEKKYIKLNYAFEKHYQDTLLKDIRQ